MPISSQIISLVTKRQTTVFVSLPVGSMILVQVEPHETFGDIKIKVLEGFGINYQRLNPEFFCFVELVNLRNENDVDEPYQTPIQDTEVVWDIMSYWERTKKKSLEENNHDDLKFLLLLQIKYPFICYPHDE